MYMLQIDVFTVLTSSLLVGCGLFLALILIWRFFLKKKELFFWSLSQLFYCLGLVLLGTRGLLPDFFSIVVGNVFIFLCYGFIWIGASVHQNRTPHFGHLSSLLVLFLVAYVYFGIVKPNIAVRVVVYDLTTILLSIGIITTLLIPTPPAKRKRMDIVASLPMFLDALTKLTLIGLQTVLMHDQSSFFRNAAVGVALLTALIVQVAWGMSVFLLVFESVVRQLKAAEAGAVEAKRLLESVLNAIPTRVFWKDRNLRYLGANIHFIHDAGFESLEGLQGKTDAELPWKASSQLINSYDKTILETGEGCFDYVQDLESAATQGLRYVLTSKVPLKDSEDRIIGVVGAYTDITEQKAAQEEIRLLLTEKEILLQEVHHRIKNNMTIISSLLSLHAGKLEDPRSAAVLVEARNKIQSMLFLYDLLYRSVDYKNLSAREYLERLLREISQVFPSSERISLTIDIRDFKLDARKMFPLGILLNEILTNSYKYAFPDPATREPKPEISVTAGTREDGLIEIVVRDNGIGYERSENSLGFGLRLVEELARQLKAATETRTEGGAFFRFLFPP